MTTIATRSELTALKSPRTGPWNRWTRRRVLDRLQALEGGRLHVIEGRERLGFGSADAADALEAEVVVRDPRFYSAVAFGGSLGAAEAYVDGQWESGDLTSVIRLMARNRQAVGRLEAGLARLRSASARVGHALRRNTRRGSRRNIEAHYDLGNDLFARFLDDTMTYSAAYFPDADATLEEAQRTKLDRICRKLRLGPDDHVVEIGTGWGSFAIHAARHYGCRVTTTTISPAQLEEARRRVEASGLGERVTLLGRDYRELEGRFDKLVSIEMIEAVGHRWYDTFFRTCGRLLKPDGLMALQTITIADRNYEEARRGVDFIQRTIFPGGSLPSVAALAASVARASALTPLHLEELGLHYAETLRRWRDRFEARWEEIAAGGYSERFRRLWRYYLSYCEGGFRERVIGNVQVILAGPAFRDDSVRGELGGERGEDPFSRPGVQRP